MEVSWSHKKYSLFVRLKKNYSGKNILKGQHFDSCVIEPRTLNLLI